MAEARLVFSVSLWLTDATKVLAMIPANVWMLWEKQYIVVYVQMECQEMVLNAMVHIIIYT